MDSSNGKRGVTAALPVFCCNGVRKAIESGRSHGKRLSRERTGGAGSNLAPPAFLCRGGRRSAQEAQEAGKWARSRKSAADATGANLRGLAGLFIFLFGEELVGEGQRGGGGLGPRP